MLQSFKNFISENQLFNQEHMLLLALSGGMDSICLFHLLHEAGYNFAVAHCNFKLRGAESDADEEFVRTLSKSKNIVFHSISFDTSAASLESRTGIQETARKLRYTWFLGLMQAHGYDKIITAHHQTDNLETMLINILRSTGIKGLHGIPLDENNIYRPLLFATKKQIENYLHTKNLTFREDASNAGNDYLRNELRHLVLPQLINIQGDAEQRFFDTAGKVRSYENIANELIKKQWTEMTVKIDEVIKIDTAKLDSLENRIPFLYYNLQDYGFKYQQIENIIHADQPGKRVMAENFELIIERNHYILQPINEVDKDGEILIIDAVGQFKLGEKLIEIKWLDNEGVINFKEPGCLYINGDNLQLPLKIRAWAEGDKIKPFGMTGYKKISDILTDRKVDNNERKRFLVIETPENEVIALLPNMIHNDYKVQSETGKIISIGIKIADS